MHVQVINFQLQDIDEDHFRQVCDQLAPAFAAIPGLLSKVWLADSVSNTYGGVYTWRDEQAMRDYAASDLFQAVMSNPHFANITLRTFGILEGPTAVTRGLVTALV